MQEARTLQDPRSGCCRVGSQVWVSSLGVLELVESELGVMRPTQE